MATEIVTRWYLEMSAPDRLAPPLPPAPGLEVRQAEVPSPEFARFLYLTVGGPWYWLDRRDWDRERWKRRVEQPGVETWVAYLRGTPAGYAELTHAGRQVELSYFGLLPDFIGQGLGPRLLRVAIARAWELGPERVTVNTCSLDGPAALRMYERTGFEIRHRIEQRVTLPDAPPGSW
jgi:ribosomal protein S18 acetylase RimI-like enzyme